MTNLFKKILAIFFSKKAKLYRIPFGPNRGLKIFTSFQISPRMLFGFDETWVSKLAKEYIKKDNIVYDVGAHIGYTSLLFSNLVGNNGQVHSFELLPNVVENYLTKTVEANQVNHIFIHPIGLADKKQNINISVGETMMGSLSDQLNETQSTVLCKVDTLDNYIKKNQLPIPQLIKVDIEQAEVAFLQGALQTIKLHKPILIIEFHNYDLLKEGYWQLKKLGYTLQTEHIIITEQTLSTFNTFYGNTLAIPE